MGIAGPIQLIRYEHLVAVVEPELDFEAMTADDERLMQAVLAHDRVLCNLFQSVTLLPLQFGTRFQSEAALVQHLVQHQDSYQTKLAQLQDQGEYLLKLVPGEPPAPPEPENNAKGREYFLAKKQRLQAQAEHQQQQHAELQSVISAIAQIYPHWCRSEPKDEVERIYLLVLRSEETALRHHCQTWQQQLSHWELSLSSALPPYHFV